RTSELQRSNEELERFAYVASHDLQEPLRMVASFVQLLKRRYAGKLDPEADEFIDFAVNGARRMQALIQDLLAFSRAGTRTEKLRETDLSETLRSVLSNLKVTIEEANATVAFDPLPTVNADPTQLSQLFQNLIINAIKFHGDRLPCI